eukprot:jgi/Tetstr1/450262/TSEL_037298.t1
MSTAASGAAPPTDPIVSEVGKKRKRVLTDEAQVRPTDGEGDYWLDPQHAIHRMHTFRRLSDGCDFWVAIAHATRDRQVLA